MLRCSNNAVSKTKSMRPTKRITEPCSYSSLSASIVISLWTLWCLGALKHLMSLTNRLNRTQPVHGPKSCVGLGYCGLRFFLRHCVWRRLSDDVSVGLISFFHFISSPVTPHCFIRSLSVPFLQILPIVAFLFFFRTDFTDSSGCLPILLSLSVFKFKFSFFHFLPRDAMRARY